MVALPRSSDVWCDTGSRVWQQDTSVKLQWVVSGHVKAGAVMWKLVAPIPWLPRL